MSYGDNIAYIFVSWLGMHGWCARPMFKPLPSILFLEAMLIVGQSLRKSNTKLRLLQKSCYAFILAYDIPDKSISCELTVRT